MKKIRMIRFLSILMIWIMLVMILTSCIGTQDTNTKTAPSNDKETSQDAQGVGESPYDLDSLEVRNFVIGHTGTRGSTNQFVSETFKKIVEEKSGGKLTIDIYGESQLGSDIAICSDVQAGAIDIQVTSPAAIITVVPEVAVFDMPFLFEDVEDARKALEQEIFYESMKEAFDKAGLHLFPFFDQRFRVLSSNKNITKFEDLRGISIRTMNNENHIAFWKALGVAPTPLDTADIFLAIQQGMLDGQENPYGQIVDKGLYDVQKYVTNSNHIFYVGCFYMSKSVWDSLSETAKQIFTDAANESIPIIQEHTDTYELSMLDKLLNEYKLTFIDFDKIEGMREKCRNRTFKVAYDSIIKTVDAALVDQFIKAAGYEPPNK